MLYRIYTEDIGRDKIIEEVASRFISFTVFDAVGYWKGKAEVTLVIEVITSDSETLHKLCQWIKWFNQQEAILLVAAQETHDFI